MEKSEHHWRVTFGNPRKEGTTTIIVRAPNANEAKKRAKVQAMASGLMGRCGTVRLMTPEDA